MTFAQLRQKEVVNTCSGSRIGNVCDLELSDDGRILALLVPAPFSLTGLFRSDTISIPWTQVVMMGEDVILVKLPDEIAE